ncbi:NF-X1-type zinc finger protein NFXL1-like [Sycon ciliatum]|uniref:NF-X1-type zinc finger protein NFXL1-like n=1 Tax=Sycon ciliatum TaxID=27933 RepID=UPI0020A93F65|eukprot:scpid17520/ scgid23520/ NF-X1-type zinc finger protein NFXL1; Ovarian zinc finger protein
MSTPPLYLGGGRGRGRGQSRPPGRGEGRPGPGARVRPPPGLSAPQRPGTSSSNDGNRSGSGADVPTASGRATALASASVLPSPPASALGSSRQQQAAAVQQRTVAMVSQLKTEGAISSSSDEDDDEDADVSMATGRHDAAILNSTLKLYQQAKDADPSLGAESLKVDATLHMLSEACSKRGNVCLVCIETIKRKDAIWNCGNCFGSLHLQCAQKWAKEGVFVNRSANAGDGGAAAAAAEGPSFWACPKCRHEYPRTQLPSFYFCYCGQQRDPEFDEWLTPHSCGNTCERKLNPQCGHTCMLLCHPGPCPPCPRMVQSRCFCRKSAPTTRRCVARGWSCHKACDKPLACGQHRCARPCHDGECELCDRQSVQPCRCGRKAEQRPCAQADWSCEKVCGRELSCRNHVCEEVCHSGECGDCPRAGQRSCPCGKSSSDLPCSEDIPTCGDTCGKLLPCRTHSCARRCHRGECDQCRQMVTKSCRCGRQKKSVPCFQELLCEFKCTALRQCQRHPCKRKCCDGNCPPCDKVCGKQLECRNHKCTAPCHQGPCYPCVQTLAITCRCGSTVSRVPCGRKRVTRPPRCLHPCRIPPSCHHSTREPHHCHMKDCPRCRQQCTLPLPGCKHTCPLPCHAHIREKSETKASLAPWEQAARSQQQDRSRPAPCPPCTAPVVKSCFGGHETASQPCSKERDYSCARSCGRSLPCGNHVCQKLCHKNSGDSTTNKPGRACQQCEEVCLKPRPPGCQHECPQRCHPGACPPCKKLINLRCHCGALPLVIPCPEYASCSDRNALRCCSDQCPKTIACGHRCRLTCHSGACSAPSECASRVTKRCACKRQSAKVKCCEASTVQLDCNDECRQTKLEKQKSAEAERRKCQDEEEAKNKAELAEFERQQQGRQRKRRPRAETQAEPGWWEKHWRKVFIALLIIVALLAVVYIFKKVSVLDKAVPAAKVPKIRRRK